MKTLRLVVVAWMACGVVQGGGLFDDFENGVLDDHWKPWAYDADSAVEESDGVLRLIEGGQVRSVPGFPTCLIEGRARLAGSVFDLIGINFRKSAGDAQPGLSCGISAVPLHPAGDPRDYNVYIVGFEDGVRNLVAFGTAPVSLGDPFDFRVVDLGRRVLVYVNDMDHPVIDVETDIRAGNQVGVHNRELSGCVTEVEHLRVRRAPVVWDDFEDGILDARLWEPSASYSNSAVSEEDGILRLVNTGLAAVIPTFSACVLDASFRFVASTWDHFDVILRSDGALGGPYGRTRNGLVVTLRPSANPDAPEVALVDIQPARLLAGASTPFPIVLNETYAVRIEDDGRTIDVYIDGSLVLSHDTRTDHGDRVVLANGNKPRYPCVTEVEWVSIDRLEPAPPEPVAIQANGVSNFLALRRGDPLRIDVTLSAGGIAGDTWILAATPWPFPRSLFVCIAPDSPQQMRWLPWIYARLGPSTRGTIPDLSATVLATPGLPPGIYTFYAGFDETANGLMEFDELTVTSVTVMIEP